MTKRPKTIDVLTPDHPRWDEFADALANTIVISDTEWHCDGDDGWGPNPNRHRYAKQVMNTMGNIDIPASLEFFKAHGGGCDCEILLNVDNAET